MDVTRLSSLAVSAAVHGALMLAFAVNFVGVSALEAGSGGDQFNIEQGIAIEGMSFAGDALETVQAVDQPPVEKVEATPPAPEVKPVEQLTETITTTNADQKEVVALADPVQDTPPEPPKPETVATEAVPEQVAIATEQASARAQTAGSPEASAKYRGELFRKIVKNARAPKTRAAGTVMLEFTIDPTGRLLDHKVVTSSGSPPLDNAALAALERGAPYPAFSDDVNTGPYTMTIPFKFTTR